MIAVVWVSCSIVLAVLLCRMAASLKAGAVQPEPDWLWDQPTDCLSDAAVKVRFDEIAAHFKVRS